MNPDETWWLKARQARDQLAARILGHPDVSLIDIGLDPRGASNTPVLRVHLRQSEPLALDLPEQIDGIPVRVVRGVYTLQRGSQASEE